MKEWTTFKGKKVTMQTIDHQHLSNCYWFQHVLWGMPVDHPHLIEIKEVLADRFNGQLLPYRPHIDFKQEIDMLEGRGHLVKDENDPRLTKIFFEGVNVGEIIKPL